MYSPFRTGDSTVDRNLDAIKSELDSLGGSTAVVRARYLGNSTASVPTAITTFTYAIKDYDTNSAYNRGVYTVPQSGVYSIAASIAITSSTIQGSALGIYVNGTAKSFGYTVRPAASGYTLTTLVSDQLSLNQGDAVEIKHNVDANSGTTYTNSPAGGNTLQVLTIRLI
jgi:hypothetical protein